MTKINQLDHLYQEHNYTAAAIIYLIQLPKNEPKEYRAMWSEDEELTEEEQEFLLVLSEDLVTEITGLEVIEPAWVGTFLSITKDPYSDDDSRVCIWRDKEIATWFCDHT